MKNKASLVFVVLALLLLIGSASAYNATLRRVNVSTMEMKAAFPPQNVTLYEGDNFLINSSITCYYYTCTFVMIYPLYCIDEDCSSVNATFAPMKTDSTYPIYSKDDIPYKCLVVDKGNKCSTNWTIRVKHPGIYTLAVMASSESAETVYSNVSTVTVRGCGDGNCTDNETFSGCPQDCCESDCTATYDRVCHKACNDYNGCSLAVGCDAQSVGYRVCISPVSKIECCGAGVTNCGLAAYCDDARCINCSYACDRACEAAACYGIDPDCARDGNASLPCCGNSRIDPKEECDGNQPGVCGNGCLRNCTCVVTTTTTSSTTTTSTTSTSTSTSTTSTTTTTTTSTTSTTVPEESSQDFLKIAPLLLAAFVLAAVAASVFYIVHFQRKKKQVSREYEEAALKESSLLKSIKETKKKFADRRISMQDATRQILAYERELEVQKKKTASLERRMGAKKSHK